MAEITATAQNGSKVRAKKLSTRIDMTPMVDLAFLLLTFFILTTKLREPFALTIEMPDKPTSERINEKHVLSLLLDRQNKIYWYTGTGNGVHLSSFSKGGIRRVILEKKASIKNMLVLIKASDQSVYKNLVDIIDEMDITGITRYALVDITKGDLALITGTDVIP